MSRRVSLPGASELFGGAAPKQTRPEKRTTTDGPAPRRHVRGPRTAVVDDRKSSGRIRHDTKITVYVTEEELLGLEQTRLALRAEHGLIGRPRPDRPRGDRRPAGRLRRPRAGLGAGTAAQGLGVTVVGLAALGPAVGRRTTLRIDCCRGQGVQRPPGQLRGPVRPAAAADQQAQAGHHRDRAVGDHRRLHRAHQGARVASGTWTRRRSSC